VHDVTPGAFADEASRVRRLRREVEGGIHEIFEEELARRAHFANRPAWPAAGGTRIARTSRMHASTTMTRDVIVVPPELALVTAWHLMIRERIRHLPVVRSGALIGMLSDRDVLARGKRLADGNLHIDSEILVGAAMTPLPLDTCEATDDITELARTMIERRIEAVPVVRGLRLIGLVTSTDLLEVLVQRGDRQESDPLPFEFRLVEDPRAYA
jgi:CBS domain-containing membrane protein